jgi:hypothetical protein
MEIASLLNCRRCLVTSRRTEHKQPFKHLNLTFYKQKDFPKTLTHEYTLVLFALVGCEIFFSFWLYEKAI